ncbi:MAG: alkaline phosphatase family protein [Planctomycetota bacterium]
MLTAPLSFVFAGLAMFGGASDSPAAASPAAFAKLPAAANTNVQADNNSRMIVIGFDGADNEIVKNLMEQNQLPNLQKLSVSGSFYPLKTTNPAQSPVSWAAFNTGLGPDSTNIYDFVCRENVDRATGEMREAPCAANAMAFRSEGDADPYLPIFLRSNVRYFTIAGIGFALFIIFFLLFRLGAKFPKSAALLLSLVLGAVGAGAAASMVRYLPTRVPIANAERRGTPFWKYLDERGVSTVGLSIPMVFPFGKEDLNHTKILAGLGVPDARQSNGDYWILASDVNKFKSIEKRAQMGLELIELEHLKDRDRGKTKTYRAKIKGPENFWLKHRLVAEQKAIKSELATGDTDPARIRILNQRADDINQELNNKLEATLELFVTPSDDGQKAAFELEHKAIRLNGADLGVGDWSELTRATFQFNPLLRLSVLVRFRVQSIDPVELYVEPLNLDPKAPPLTAPISYPSNFSAELANDRDIRDFETLGWACATNPLKDQAIDEKTFLEDIEEILRQRERILHGRLAKNDWRLFYMVFGETDRVQHLMFRFFDEQHPLYNKEDAEKKVTFFGKTMAQKDCIPEIYRQADRIVGDVLKKCTDGRTHLLVVSDHGFAPFRWQVHTNSWLWKNGYLTLRELNDDEKEDIATGRKTLKDLNDKDGLSYFDWSKTKAYSLGLGKIYINVKGREPQGIVDPAEQEKLEREIAEKLEKDIDAATGKAFVKTAYLARDIYPNRGKGLKPGERDNSEDIILGFNKGYRVSWDSTLGGFGGFKIDEKTGALYCESVIANNDEKWSGDHCSVDPSIVTGIFFSTLQFELPADAQIPDVRHCAPTILKFFGIDVPDGQRAPMIAKMK